MSRSPEALAAALKARARELGFGAVGIASPEPSRHMGRYRRWIEEGRHGEMAYLARPDAVSRRADLRETLPSVRSVVVVAHDHFQEDPPGVPGDPSRGVVARYARGRDYHRVVRDRLCELHEWLQEEAGRPVEGRAYVDTGPLLERELAQRAGLGWLGKNTMLIHPRRGSYLFLGVLLLDLPLPPDPPFEADRCGSCRACLEACPTGALLGRDEGGAPVLDARLCISYLTIEHRGPVPRELRTALGSRIFGCDICQEVCPWNRRFARPAPEPAYRARRGMDGPALVELLGLDEGAFGEMFSGSPVKRAKRGGFLRSVAVALGNALAGGGTPGAGAVGALAAALADPDPLVRGHAAWALGRAGGRDAVWALSRRRSVEEDPWVREEISEALERCGAPRVDASAAARRPGRPATDLDVDDRT